VQGGGKKREQQEGEKGVRRRGDFLPLKKGIGRFSVKKGPRKVGYRKRRA